MADVWEKSFDDIQEDGHSIFQDSMNWGRCMALVNQKWNPLKNLSDEDLERFRQWVDKQVQETGMAYMNDTGLCAFCRKAEVESGTSDYGREGNTCALCILVGRCFDEGWVVRDIFIALHKGEWEAFRKLVEKGLEDVREMVTEKEEK